MLENIKFIHAADLHLDSPFKGMSTLPSSLYQELKSSTFSALDNLVKLAIDEAVDFVLIVGDLFDQSLRSVYAEMQFLLACEKLAEADIPVYLSYGNHDYLNAKNRTLKYPDNLHVFDSDQVECKIFNKNGHPLVAIHGFSYLEQAVLSNKALEFQPIEGVPYQIGMLHGSTGQADEHDNYAPFQLSDLRAKKIDYWALGHIHKRAILGTDPAIVYPGNTQGRSSKELGEKGCYLVELDQTETKLTFVPLQFIRFENVTVDLKDCDDLDQVYQLINDKLNQFGQKKIIVYLNLINASQQMIKHYHQGDLKDLIDVFNEQQADMRNWIWIQSYKVEQEKEAIENLLKTRDPFIKQLLKQFDQVDWNATAKDLWQHRQAKRFLPELTDDEKKEIIEAAKELALYQLIGVNQNEN